MAWSSSHVVSRLEVVRSYCMPLFGYQARASYIRALEPATLSKKSFLIVVIAVMRMRMQEPIGSWRRMMMMMTTRKGEKVEIQETSKHTRYKYIENNVFRLKKLNNMQTLSAAVFVFV